MNVCGPYGFYCNGSSLQLYLDLSCGLKTKGCMAVSDRTAETGRRQNVLSLQQSLKYGPVVLLVPPVHDEVSINLKMYTFKVV